MPDTGSFSFRAATAAHRLACAPKEKHRGEAGQRHRVNRSEMRWTKFVETLSSGARAARNKYRCKNRKNQKEWICIADSVKQLCPAEILEMITRSSGRRQIQHEQPLRTTRSFLDDDCMCWPA